MSDFKYDAFISYRHLEPDSFVAEHLHKLLESYTLPKNIQKVVGRKKLKRVFRDREELPITDSLNDQILDALDQSEFLIVICSPRLEESKWCKREIETFVSKRGKKNVLLVLADGEPDTAFPKLIYDGTTEPLAAEARGENNRERLQKLKVEKLRILAQMLGVGFDDLKQRQKERRIKTILTAVSAAAVIAFAFAALAITSAVRINNQAKMLAHDRAIDMAEESTRLLNDDKRLEALKVSYEALTTSGDVDMPYTAEAQYALVDALRVYDSAKYSKAVLEIDTNDTVCAMVFNSNPFEVIYADRSGNVAVWLYQEYSKIFETFDGIKDSQSAHVAGFVDKDTIFYIDERGAVRLVSISDGASDNDVLLSDAVFRSVYIDDEHDKIAALSTDSVFVYDLKDYSVLYTDSIADLEFADCVGWDESGRYLMYSVCNEDNSVREELRVADVYQGEVIITALFAEASMKDCACDNSVFYVLSGKTVGDLSKSYVCALDMKNGLAKWNSTFNGEAGKVYITSNNAVAVTAGNDVYLYQCSDGALLGNYSFNANVGCLTEQDGALYVRNLNGDSSVIDSATGAYSYLGKLIECTGLNMLKPLEITKYNYAYMGVAANGNDNHLIFYNYMVNDFATICEGVENTLSPIGGEILYGTDARSKAMELGADADNTVYAIVSDDSSSTGKDAEGFLVISYKNGMVSVYDNKMKTITCSRSVGDVIDRYFGEDVCGNIYFGNESMGIMISPEGQVVAHIEDMLGLTSDKTGILMQSYDEQRHPVVLKYDVFDLNALLELAEVKMDYYNYH